MNDPLEFKKRTYLVELFDKEGVLQLLDFIHVETVENEINTTTLVVLKHVNLNYVTSSGGHRLRITMHSIEENNFFAVLAWQ